MIRSFLISSTNLQENVKTSFHKAKLETKRKRFLERTKEIARAEILNNEHEG